MIKTTAPTIAMNLCENEPTKRIACADSLVIVLNTKHV